MGLPGANHRKFLLDSVQKCSVVEEKKNLQAGPGGGRGGADSEPSGGNCSRFFINWQTSTPEHLVFFSHRECYR